MGFVISYYKEDLIKSCNNGKNINIEHSKNYLIQNHTKPDTSSFAKKLSSNEEIIMEPIEIYPNKSVMLYYNTQQIDDNLSPIFNFRLTYNILSDATDIILDDIYFRQGSS